MGISLNDGGSVLPDGLAAMPRSLLAAGVGPVQSTAAARSNSVYF
jgi:hypothetical protein